MSGATTFEVPLLHEYHAEWRSFLEHSHNVLIEGSVADTETVVALLQPHLREPMVCRQPSAPLDLAGAETRALIVRDAGTLSLDEQRRLLAWIRERGSRAQIISTTTQPLYALVADGRFDTALYYRLNVLLLHVGVACGAGSPDGAADV